MKYSPGRAAVAGAVVLLLDYAAFLFVLALGLVVLFRRHTLDAGEIIPSSILFALSIFLATLIYLGIRSAESLGRALAWMARAINRFLRPFLKRDYLSEERAYAFASDTAEGLQLLLETPYRLAIPVSLALLKQILLITILWCSLRAFQVSFSSGNINCRLCYWLPVSDRFSNTCWPGFCGRRAGAGINLYVCAIQPGCHRHPGIPRFHFLDPSSGRNDLVSCAGQDEGISALFRACGSLLTCALSGGNIIHCHDPNRLIQFE
jgi:hypothetical protein